MVDLKIAELRKRNGMTQQELGDALSVSFKTISKWENGTCLPDIYTLPMLSKIFNVSLDALLGLVPLDNSYYKSSNSNQAVYWENTILKMYGERYEADPSPIQDRRMGYYNDTDQLDFVFYEKENWRTEVWEMLTQAKDFAVEGAVNKDEVAAWKYRTLNWYNSGKSQHTNPVKYISYEDLDRFTSYAVEKCEEYLQSKGFGDFEISG